MDVEARLPFVDFLCGNLTFSVHCPNGWKNLESRWDLGSMDDDPVLVVSVSLDFGFHCIDEVGTIWGVERLVDVQDVGIVGCCEGNGILQFGLDLVAIVTEDLPCHVDDTMPSICCWRLSCFLAVGVVVWPALVV
jgi:hypothetical protein